MKAELEPLEQQHRQLPEQLQGVIKRRGVVQENLGRERQSFEAWRAARAVTSQSDQNPEPLQRARQLNAQLEQERSLGEQPAPQEERLQQIHDEKALLGLASRQYPAVNAS